MPLLVGNQEHAFLRFGAFHLVILNDKLLFENLDGVKLLRRLGLRQHDLSEISFTEDSQEIEVIKANFLRALLLLRCWLWWWRWWRVWSCRPANAWPGTVSRVGLLLW